METAWRAKGLEGAGPSVAGDLFGSVVRTVVAVGVWGVVHSLLASRRSKRAAARVVGMERRRAWYRLGYNAVAVGSAAGLAVYVHRLPDCELYCVRWPWRAVTGGVRWGLMAWAAWAGVLVGVGEFSGFGEAARWWRGGAMRGTGRVFPPRELAVVESEGQGPPVRWARERGGGESAAAATGDATGDAAGDFGALALDVRGPFQASRNPLNFAGAAVFCLTPRMTVVRLTVALLMTAYAVAGSWLSERRLRAAYGGVFAAYQRSGVPFFVPRLGGGE